MPNEPRVYQVLGLLRYLCTRNGKRVRRKVRASIHDFELGERHE